MNKTFPFLRKQADDTTLQKAGSGFATLFSLVVNRRTIKEYTPRGEISVRHGLDTIHKNLPQPFGEEVVALYELMVASCRANFQRTRSSGR